MTQILTKIIENVQDLEGDLETLELEIISLVEKAFCEALREHSEHSEPFIRKAWLNYSATNLRFEV